MQKEFLQKALKGGMKGELDSIHFYQHALANASYPEVVDFFKARIEEEKRHYNYLLDYYRQLDKNVDPGELAQLLEAGEAIEFLPITQNVIERIGENTLLFSAFSTAALLEKEAMQYYKECAELTDLPVLKEFFLKMVEFETQHYDEMLRIEKEAEIAFWNANKFEPF